MNDDDDNVCKIVSSVIREREIDEINRIETLLFYRNNR